MAKKKARSKTVVNPETGRKKTVHYGQKGAEVKPGTAKGDSYCARSAAQMKKYLNRQKIQTAHFASVVNAGSVLAKNQDGPKRSQR